LWTSFESGKRGREKDEYNKSCIPVGHRRLTVLCRRQTRKIRGGRREENRLGLEWWGNGGEDMNVNVSDVYLGKNEQAENERERRVV